MACQLGRMDSRWCPYEPTETTYSKFKRFACCHRPFAHVPALTYGRRGGARATASTAAPSATARACVPLTGTVDAAGVIEESNESNPARSAHMPALRILMQPLHTPSPSLQLHAQAYTEGQHLQGALNLHTPSPSLQHACTSTHRGAALTGRPQPSGCQSS